MSCSPTHTVPLGRFAFLGVFQAINCLATIIQSLRDNSRAFPGKSKPSTPVHIFEATSRGRASLSFEDEDDDEDDFISGVAMAADRQ